MPRPRARGTVGDVDKTASPLPPASSAPPWLQRLGTSAWLLVGVVLVTMGAIWLLAATSSISEPLIFGAIVGAVGSGLLTNLEGRGVPRAAGAGLLLLAIILVGAVIAGLVLGGITSQEAEIDRLTSQAVDKMQGWANDLGITSAQDAAQDVKKAVPDLGKTLLSGLIGGLSGLKNVLVFLGFSAFTTFFLLKDGPAMTRWVEGHMAMPRENAQIVTRNLARALRQYFLGLTIVAAFNAVVVGLGALALGVPLPGTIAVVTFVAGYVPIVGAWTAGIFVFLLALAAQGTDTAILMGLIIFLANGPMQQIVQPIAYGATLQLNPLVVFSVTIGAGALFGMLGLVLAAPLVSGIVHINADLAEKRTAEAGGAGPPERAPSGAARRVPVEPAAGR